MLCPTALDQKERTILSADRLKIITGCSQFDVRCLSKTTFLCEAGCIKNIALLFGKSGKSIGNASEHLIYKLVLVDRPNNSKFKNGLANCLFFATILNR